MPDHRPTIDINRTADGDVFGFAVVVRDGASESRHQVTMSRETFERLARGRCAPEQCVDAIFRFLLDREPKESILPRFDVTVVARYFPDFEQQLPGYLL